MPNELNKEEQINLVREYVQDNFVNIGMCADIAIHSGHKQTKKIKNENEEQDQTITLNNPHAHILLTTRFITKNGFSDKKNRDWDKRENVFAWREGWANACNQEFKKRNMNIKIDHRSFKEQGITDRLPTIHMGVAATRLEKKGIKTEKGNANREIKKSNEGIKKITADLQELENELKHLEKQHRIYQPTSQEKNNPFQFLEGADIVFETESFSKKMAELKNKYIHLVFDKEKIINTQSHYSAEISKMEIIIRGIIKNISAIGSADKEIVKLQQERLQKNVFQRKDKKEIDEKINDIEISKNRAMQSLKQYGTTKDHASERIEELTTRKIDMEQKKLKLPTPQALSERQNQIGMEYKKLLIILELHPDKDIIKVAEKKHADENITTSGKGNSVKMELGKLKAIQELEIISTKEFLKIKSELPDHIQKLLAQQNKQYDGNFQHRSKGGYEI